MADLSKTIEAKSDQLNSDDLVSGSITIKVTDVKETGNKDQPISIYYEGDNGKPYKPCKTCRRILVHVWGAGGKSYVGRSMTLYRDEKVKFGGLEVGGIRISHMSNIDSPITMALTASKANKKPFTVKPLLVTQPTSADPDVVEAGNEAAANGVQAYSEWLATLTADTKATIKHLHSGWSKKAKEADASKEEIV